MVKRKPFRAMVKLLLVIPLIFKVMANTSELVKDEARTAMTNGIKLLLLLVFTSSLIVISWLTLLAMLLLYLVSLQLSWILSVAIVFLVNSLVVMILILLGIKIKNNLLFPQTKLILRLLTRKRMLLK